MPNVDIFIKSVDQTKGFSSVNRSLGTLGKNVSSLNRGLNPLQAGLTGLATVGLDRGISALGSGIKAAVGGFVELNNANNELNAGLANVQSLGVSREALDGYRDGLQQLSIDVNKTTDDLTEGLYQVVSAFGETSESQKILAINARAATAGVASTQDAINLTSAVTKGYNDVSAEAIQNTADLAFKTVELGQTTFPELAASIGKVVPLAQALGVEQEELFAQYATLTGVTGSTAEVGTQLRATYQALLRPTKEGAEAISKVSKALDEQGRLVNNDLTKAWRKGREILYGLKRSASETSTEILALNEAGEGNGKVARELEKQLSIQEKAIGKQQLAVIELAAGLGQSIVESVGFNEALSLVSETADGNSNTLAKMYGSVESLSAVLSLGGAQAENFAEKYDKITEAAGAADAAFEAQTEGINKSGFELERIGKVIEVFKQDLGAEAGNIFGPLIGQFSDFAATSAPLVTKALAEAAPGIQSTIASWFSDEEGQSNLNIADLITFDLDDSVSSFVNIADFIKFEKLTFDHFVSGESVSFDIGKIFQYDKLSFADVVETTISADEGFFKFSKIEKEDFLETNIAIRDLFDKTTRIDAGEIFERTTYLKLFTTESTISSDELFGTTKYNLADLFSLETTIGFDGLFGESKFEIGDLFSNEVTWSPAEVIRKVSFADLVDFSSTLDLSTGLKFTSIDIGDVIDLDFEVDLAGKLQFTKLKIGDVIDWDFGEGGGFWGRLFTDKEGYKLQAQQTLNRMKESFNVSAGDVDSGSLAGFSNSIDSFEWPELPEWTWTEYPAWTWIDYPVWSWAEYPAWMWEEYPIWSWVAYPVWEWVAYPAWKWVAYPTWKWAAYPAWKWATYPKWKWPSLPKFTWPSIPKPAWFTSIFGQALGGDIRKSGVYRFNEFGQEGVLRDGRLTYPKGDYTYLQRGDRVVTRSQLDSAESINYARAAQPQFAGAGAVAGGPTINLTLNANIANNMDLDRVAMVVAEKLKARLSR